jgi:hypothetical protein
MKRPGEDVTQVQAKLVGRKVVKVQRHNFEESTLVEDKNASGGLFSIESTSTKDKSPVKVEAQ